jgi:hypothetical protein
MNACTLPTSTETTAKASSSSFGRLIFAHVMGLLSTIDVLVSFLVTRKVRGVTHTGLSV